MSLCVELGKQCECIRISHLLRKSLYSNAMLGMRVPMSQRSRLCSTSSHSNSQGTHSVKYLIIFSVAVLSFLAGKRSSNGFVWTILV